MAMLRPPRTLATSAMDAGVGASERLAWPLRKLTCDSHLHLRPDARSRKALHQLHTGIGEPAYDTPAPAPAAAHRSLDEKRIRFAPAHGLPELRYAIAAFYSKCPRIEVGPQGIIITSGSADPLVLCS